jgi:hypothetical protein
VGFGKGTTSFIGKLYDESLGAGAVEGTRARTDTGIGILFIQDFALTDQGRDVVSRIVCPSVARLVRGCSGGA